MPKPWGYWRIDMDVKQLTGVLGAVFEGINLREASDAAL